MAKKIFLAVAILSLASGEVRAHPVAYQGSVGLMTEFSRETRMVEMNYSIRHWLAADSRVLWLTPGSDRPDAMLGGMNLLLHRWNGENYQANIYGEFAAGRSRLSGAERGAYYAGVQGDIEDRKYYGLIHVDTLRNSESQETNHYKVRAGFAPYVEEFDAFHTWFILQAERYTHLDSKFEVSPFLRFFYRNVLWEIGSSFKGDLKLNTIMHF
jgi:hypothetical protein